MMPLDDTPADVEPETHANARARLDRDPFNPMVSLPHVLQLAGGYPGALIAHGNAGHVYLHVKADLNWPIFASYFCALIRSLSTTCPIRAGSAMIGTGSAGGM